MKYQDLKQLKPGTLIKLNSEIYIWETRDWDGIKERLCVFLKHLGEGKHMCRDDNPYRTPDAEFKKGTTTGTTGCGIHDVHIHIIRLFTNGKVIAIEAAPEFVINMERQEFF